MYSVTINGPDKKRIFYYSSWDMAVDYFYRIKVILKIEGPTIKFGDRTGFSKEYMTQNEDLYFSEEVNGFWLTLSGEILDIVRTDVQLKDIMEGLR